ncbi:MAG: hypothetical protein L0G27_03870 [Paracoccus sp. (in: a-proteobacteria)]|nr:hypothetical protein [Paracoccus sp. (in: a-proteobacteria)]
MTERIFRTEGARITAFSDGPDWDGHPATTVGAFSCTSRDAGRVVLQQALAYLRDGGATRVIGPMDGDTWHSYRFVTETDGSPPFLLEPPDAKDALTALTETGFTPISRYFSARVPLAQAGATPPPANQAFVIETWDGTDPDGLFGQVYDLSTAAFARNAFYKPISRADFLSIYRPVLPLLKRELIFFARRPNSTLAGFLFGVPNYAEGPQPRSAILKTYASLERGAGQHLAHAFHTAAADAGYDTAIHALIHDDNLSALRSASEGAQIFRRYGLFGMTL